MHRMHPMHRSSFILLYQYGPCYFVVCCYQVVTHDAPRSQSKIWTLRQFNDFGFASSGLQSSHTFSNSSLKSGMSQSLLIFIYVGELIPRRFGNRRVSSDLRTPEPPRGGSKQEGLGQEYLILDQECLVCESQVSHTWIPHSVQDVRVRLGIGPVTSSTSKQQYEPASNPLPQTLFQIQRQPLDVKCPTE